MVIICCLALAAVWLEQMKKQRSEERTEQPTKSWDDVRPRQKEKRTKDQQEKKGIRKSESDAVQAEILCWIQGPRMQTTRRIFAEPIYLS
jgi:tetrahydrodipicolinate N-succinyltransferase